MASPGIYGASYGTSLGTGSLGAQTSRTQLTVETAIDRNWQFDVGEHKQHCSKDGSEFLEQGLQTLAKSREPGLHDGYTRHATIERLQELLRDPQVFPQPSQLQLVPYGSFLSSCYSRSSDLDLALMGTVSEAVLGRSEGLSAGAPVPLERVTREECVLLLQRLANALESRQLTRGSVDRNPLEARVPIIKFEEANSGIECDVCVTTRGCDFKASIMRLLHGLQPSLAPLIQLVKVWAKHHDINSAHFSTLNSWSLALMVMFSLQTYPGGNLLPPLWRVFHDEEPGGPGGAGRPLQDKNLPLDMMLVVAEARCGDEGERLMAPVWAHYGPPGLLEQLLWFLSCFTSIMNQWKDNAAHRNWRVSTWLGRGYVSRFQKAYLAAVEEPFDCNDNTARSLGIRERNENTLPYVAWVFGHSLHLLRNVKGVEDGARVLAWLFGPEALPSVGLQLLKPSGVSKAFLRRLEKMAGGGRTRNGEEGEAEEEEPDVRMADFKRRLAFRALLDAMRMGSPIMTLDDWRLHHSTRGGRPPFEWHKLAPLTPPLTSPPQPPPLTSPAPPKLNANPQSPYSGQLGVESGFAPRLLHQSMSPEMWRMGGRADQDVGVVRDPGGRVEERRWRSLAEDLDSLFPRPQGLQRGELGSLHPPQSQHQQHEQEQQQQHDLALRRPGFFPPAEALNGFGAPNGSSFASNGQDEVRMGGSNGLGASLGATGAFGGGGGAGAFGGFGGFMNPAVRGVTAIPEPLVPTQRQSLDQLLIPPPPLHQQHQHQHQQHQKDVLRQSTQQVFIPSQQHQHQQQLGPGPGFIGSGLPDGLPQAAGDRAMAGRSILDALRTGSAKEGAVVAAANARDAVAKAGLGGMTPAANSGAGDVANPATSISTSISTSLFGGAAQDSDRPVSAFSFHSGIRVQAPQTQQVPKQQQQQQVPGGYPSLSSPLFSLSMSTSGNSQLLQWESSQSVPQPQPHEQQQQQQQQQKQQQLNLQAQPDQQSQQNHLELQELLRLLSVYPGNQSSNLLLPQPQPHQQNVMPFLGSQPQSAQLAQLSQPSQPLAIATAAGGGYPLAETNPHTRMFESSEIFQNSTASPGLGVYAPVGVDHCPESTPHRPIHHAGVSSYDPVVSPTGLAVQSPQYYASQSPHTSQHQQQQQPRQEQRPQAQAQQQQVISPAGRVGFGLPYPFSSIFGGAAGGGQGGGDAGTSASTVSTSMGSEAFGPGHNGRVHNGQQQPQTQQQQSQLGFGVPGTALGLLPGQARLQPPLPLSSSVPASYSIFGQHQPQLQPQPQQYVSNAFGFHDPKQYPGGLGDGGVSTRNGATSSSTAAANFPAPAPAPAPAQHNFGSVGSTYNLSATASGSYGNTKASPRVSSDGSTKQTGTGTGIAGTGTGSGNGNGNGNSSLPARANGGQTFVAAAAPRRPPGF
ncbi:hypothetical protein VaNZ11_009682 [Volvox africanus]|uniref:Poly(A) RNA polymerase mitochondrial-like central palm domain-containing protein n=1 Tax=Volvox africanus TaxID=51714 RepID=A0ABQ5S8V2_9CHLO|nr:hypothetical protein VaNZ11_009682 [Volvox africanus]